MDPMKAIPGGISAVALLFTVVQASSQASYLRGKTSMWSICCAAICPTLLPLTPQGAATFMLGHDAGELYNEHFAREHFGHDGPGETLIVTENGGREISHITARDITDGEPGEPVLLAECWASWIAVLGTPDTILNPETKYKLLLRGGAVMTATFWLTWLINLAQSVVSAKYNGPTSVVHTIFCATLWTNWAFFMAQWASTFSYSNAYRGVFAPWMDRPMNMNGVNIIYSHLEEVQMDDVIRNLSVGERVATYLAAIIIALPPFLLFLRVPTRWRGWLRRPSQLREVFRSFAYVPEPSPVTNQPGSVAGPRWSRTLEVTFTQPNTGHRLSTNTYTVDQAVVGGLGRPWHGGPVYRTAFSVPTLVSISTVVVVAWMGALNKHFQLPEDSQRSIVWASVSSLLWLVLTYGVGFLQRCQPRLNSGLY